MLQLELQTIPILLLLSSLNRRVLAAPTLLPTTTTTTTLNDRSTFQVLADGSSYQSGDINQNLRWQASGLLSIGCPESIGIQDCYTMSLNSNGDLEESNNNKKRKQTRLRRGTSFESLAAHDDGDLEAYTSPWNAIEEMYWQESQTSDQLWGEGRNSSLRKRQDVKKCDSGGGGGGSSDGGEDGGGGGGGNPKPPTPRQRIEMFSWPGHRSGETLSFSWKSHQGSTSITSSFFHTWQILRRDCGGGPIVTLDFKGGKAVISDNMRGCIDCTSVDASVFIERTVQHELVVTFGISGSINYRAYDVTTTPQESDRNFNFTQRPPVLTYSAYGDMGDQASLKFGQYRAVTEGLRDVTTFVGDYEAKRLN